MKDQALAFNWNSNDSSVLKERETALTDAFDLVKEDQSERDKSEREGHAVIRCGWTKAEKSREVADKYERKQC